MARKAVLDAVDRGWRGPPFDPIELASIRGITVRPNAAIADARVFWVNGRFQIEYNPHRPRGRVNFSIAHEIAHTFFEDCGEEVRNRRRDRWEDRRWQLELLCNVGAAEMMMPVGSFPSGGTSAVTIEEMMRLRKEYQVSVEAILIRLVKLASSRVACFAATRMERAEGMEYRIDYRIGSAPWLSWARSRQSRQLASEVLDQCVAIGTTAKGVERWRESGLELHIEAVALPPLPGTEDLRIAGLIRPASEVPSVRGIRVSTGQCGRVPRIECGDSTHSERFGSALGGSGFRVGCSECAPKRLLRLRVVGHGNAEGEEARCDPHRLPPWKQLRREPRCPTGIWPLGYAANPIRCSGRSVVRSCQEIA